jgi:hypothetical protein
MRIICHSRVSGNPELDSPAKPGNDKGVRSTKNFKQVIKKPTQSTSLEIHARHVSNSVKGRIGSVVLLSLPPRPSDHLHFQECLGRAQLRTRANYPPDLSISGCFSNSPRGTLFFLILTSASSVRTVTVPSSSRGGCGLDVSCHFSPSRTRVALSLHRGQQSLAPPSHSTRFMPRWLQLPQV